ncbi:MAG: GGDEF domain-containing protein [Aquisalimonadaceae bacterium]
MRIENGINPASDLEITAREIADAPTTEAMLEIFCTEAARRVPMISGGLLLHGGGGDYAALTGVWEAGQSWVGGLRGMSQHNSDRDADACVAELNELPPERRITVPLQALGMSVGELRLWSPSGGRPSEDEVAVIRLLAVTLAVSIAGTRLQGWIRGSSVRDPLTSLFNRRYLEDTLPRECHRCSREHRPLGLIHLDLDAFTAYNTRHGRHAGDRLLQATAGLIQASFRGSDLACRLGAGQFIIAMPDSSLDNTCRRGGDLLALIRELQVDPRRTDLPGVTASVGVADFPQSADNAAELLAAADSARLLARQAGGDQVQAAQRIE